MTSPLPAAGPSPFAPLLALAGLLFAAACAGESADADPAPSAQTEIPCPDDAEGVSILGAWVRATSNANGMTAAYFNVCNHGREAIEIVSASTPIAGAVELHETSRSAGGVVSMRPISSLPVAAGGAARLAPGGAHLMLMRLAGEIAAGDSVPLTLTLSNGETVDVAATAKAREATAH